MRNVFLDQVRKAVLGDTTDKYISKYFKASEAAEGVRKRLMHNSIFLAPTPSFVCTKTLDTFADQCRVRVLGSTTMAAVAKNDVAVGAEASVVHEAPAPTNFKPSTEESWKKA